MPEKFYLLLSEPECTNVCFWYIPERYERGSPEPSTSVADLNTLKLNLDPDPEV